MTVPIYNRISQLVKYTAIYIQNRYHLEDLLEKIRIKQFIKMKLHQK
jgi:hypothetical protein